MILMLDNYDSFTYNLVQMITVLGEQVRVCRNDEPCLLHLEAQRPMAMVVSPGPGTPSEAGLCVETIRHFAPRIPFLGICLGHQALAYAFGGRVVRAPRLMHGKVSRIHHDGRGIFRRLPCPFKATRYHSLIVEEITLPDCFRVSAWTEEGEIMGIRHNVYRAEGIQFHPESILTEHGGLLMENFVRFGKE